MQPHINTRFTILFLLSHLVAAGLLATNPQGQRFYPTVPKELLHLRQDQCTSPAQSAIHPVRNEENNLGLVTGEVWFRVNLKLGQLKDARPLFSFPTDSEFTRIARDSLMYMNLAGPNGAGDKDGWYFHRVLVLAEDESLIGPDTAVPAPLDSVVRNESGVVHPEMIYYGTPEYPKAARGRTGLVWIRARVAADGTVLNARVLKTAGSKELDESAVKAAYKNHFKPALKHGEPVPMWVTWKTEFKLSDK